ncbi:MAG TPA: trigger factor [Gemmatimonadales bacterium]|nr:trigger factor [Gemmatimonadales bacterium]
MPAILIKKTSEEPGAASLAVTVPVEHVREAEERATTDYQRRARLPGFRKGKAPSALVRKQFADDIRKHALEEMIRESWKAALAQEALKPVADPHIHNLKWDAGAPLTFEFHVEVKPDLKLERIGKFTLKRKVPKVTEDQVVAQLEELRAQKAPWTPVAGEKPKLKDLVDVTIATREGGGGGGGGGEARDPQSYQLVLGGGQTIPDVEERIMELLPGETVDATVRFPSDFSDESKRGQTRDVRITLNEVKRQQLAELDDAFAREVGDFDSLEALRKAVREDLEKEAGREADAQVRRDLIEQIVQANRVAAPRPLVERAVYTYAQAYGIPEDRWPDFSREFTPAAEAQVRRDLILDWLVEHHDLRATDAEVEQRIAELAARRGGGMPAAELRASLEKAKRLRDLERGLTEEKVFTFLLSQSTVEQT